MVARRGGGRIWLTSADPSQSGAVFQPPDQCLLIGPLLTRDRATEVPPATQ